MTVVTTLTWTWIASSQSLFTTVRSQPFASGTGGLSSNPEANSAGSLKTTSRQSFGRITELDLVFQVSDKIYFFLNRRQCFQNNESDPTYGTIALSGTPLWKIDITFPVWKKTSACFQQLPKWRKNYKIDGFQFVSVINQFSSLT
jgi:hypothetical protein